jgi:tetratricopeptide (TPR) repeat protein
LPRYHAALEERTRERSPLDWALTQNNLGTTLARLGEWQGSAGGLKEAIATFRAALEERTCERVPVDWAQTQENLGLALRALAERTDDLTLWRETAEIFEHLVSARLVNVLASARSADQQRALASLSHLGDIAALAWVAAGDPERGLRAAHRARAVQASVIAWADREAADDSVSRELRARRAAWQAANDAADAVYHRSESSGGAEDCQRYQTQVALVREAFDGLRYRRC